MGFLRERRVPGGVSVEDVAADLLGVALVIGVAVEGSALDDLRAASAAVGPEASVAGSAVGRRACSHHHEEAEGSQEEELGSHNFQMG